MPAPRPLLEQFTPEQQTNILRLHAAGESQKEIAGRYSVPRRTIMKLLEKLGAPKKTPSGAQRSRLDLEFIRQVTSLRACGMTLEDIAAATSRSISAVHRVLCRYGDNKPPKSAGPNPTAICAEYEAGTTIAKLATRYGVSSITISQILRDSNIKIRDPIIPGGGAKQRAVELPVFEDTQQWWIEAHAKYGTPSLASFVGWTKHKVRKRLRDLGISKMSLTERARCLDPAKVLEDYQSLGNMTLVAKKHRCTVQAIKNHLSATGISIRQTSEIFAGDDNPFAGEQHSKEIATYCREIGAAAGAKFWLDHPEYIEVVRAKNKQLWTDLNRRREDSRRISELRKQGKCGSHKGVMTSRFGEMAFDSSYECAFIEWCEKNPQVIHLERDFMVLEYEYAGERCFVPDFKIWLPNGDFLIVEVKSDWYARQPKERAKITAGFGQLIDKFMVEDSFSLVQDRIGLSLSPLGFDFSDVVLRRSEPDEYNAFYAAYHYMGRTGRRGYTWVATLAEKVVAAGTFSSLTRNHSASRLGVTPSAARELVRLCIHPDFHKRNFGSWFLSRATKSFLGENPDVNVLLTFADTTVGHNGAVYLAANWVHDGCTKPSYHYVASDGTNVHKKTVYDRAMIAGIHEREWAAQQGLVRVREDAKRRFILSRDRTAKA